MASGVAERASVPIPADDSVIVDRLTDPASPEHHALADLVDELGTSKAAVLAAALHLGIERIRDEVREQGYRQLAQEVTAAERAEDRAITASRRRRLAERREE